MKPTKSALKQRESLYQKSLKDKREKIQCLICKRWYRQVGTHVVQTHGMTAKKYRRKLGFDVKKGQLPKDYKKLKAKQAIDCGGYKNLKKGKQHWFKKKQKGVGTYERSEQTLERLKLIGSHTHNKRRKGGCKICKKKLTGNQTKYCSIEHRQLDYKTIYNPHKVTLFKKKALCRTQS